MLRPRPAGRRYLLHEFGSGFHVSHPGTAL